MLVDLVAPIGRHARRLDAGEELGEIGEREGRVVLLEEADHFLRDVALVEAVARRHDAGAAALALVGALGFDHPGQRARERRELDGFAGLVHGAVRLEPVALVVRPLLDEFRVPPDRRRGARPQRKALLGVFDRPRRDRLEAHGAPLIQHRERRMQRARNHRGIEALAVEGLAPRRVPVDGGALGRPALSDHRDDLAGAARIDQHQSFAAQAVEILLDHAADQQRRDAGIERIAAARENLERRRRGQRVACRYAAIAPHDRRPFGGAGGGGEETGQREQREGAENGDTAGSEIPNQRSG